MASLEEFIRDRNEALISLDKKKIEAYCRKYGVHLPKNEEVFWAEIHKARLQIVDITREEKIKSAEWLAKHGFRLEIY